MKKSVILILIAVYVLSIAIVGFLGLNVRIYAPNVPPTSIEITHVTYLDQVKEPGINSEGQKHIVIEGFSGDQVSAQLRISVLPDNATDKSVIFSFDPGENVSEKDGLIVFTRPTDGSNVIFITIKATLKENKTIYDDIIVAVFFS